MAERIVRQLIDDLDGTEIPDGKGEHVVFTIRGVRYEMDLSKPNVAKFDKAVKPYIDAAEKVPSRTAKRSARASKGRRDGSRAENKQTSLAAMREWARENGFEVSERGRLRSEVVDAYDAAQRPS